MSSEKNRKIILIIAIAVIALNLRPSLTGVGPLIPEIRLDTGLSNFYLGLLTTLPLLSLGILSIFTPLLTRRIGMEGTMTLALILLTGGILLRVIPTLPALFIGTILLGTGIAFGNVLLPGVVKSGFPHRFGMVTGIYSAMLGLGAAIGSGISIPMSEGLGLGWRWALGAWGGFSFLALLIWLSRMNRNFSARDDLPADSFTGSLKRLGSSRLAWHIAFFMGLQSLTFYILITWLPEILIERNLSPAHAGWLVALLQVTGATGTLFMPSWAARLPTQRLPVLLIIAGELIGIIGLMLPTPSLTIVWVVILGISSGSSFGMALLFIGLRARDSETANQLSAMAQSAGYLLAAGGPAFFGAFYEVMQSWTLPLVFLLAVTLLKLWSGLGASRDEI